jgi:hypothetical protein
MISGFEYDFRRFLGWNMNRGLEHDSVLNHLYWRKFIPLLELQRQVERVQKIFRMRFLRY